MRRLVFLLLLIPALVSAQNDQHYLAGAVPEVGGRVVFSKEFSAPSLTQDQLFDLVVTWADGYFDKEKERIVYQNKATGELAIHGNTYLVFQSTALSLDRAQMNYQMVVNCDGNLCKMKITSIRYTYDVAYQRDPEKYLAEEYITDKVALNKKGNMIRGMAKFRKATIDYADKTMDSALSELNKNYLANSQAAPGAISQPAAPAAPVVPITVVGAAAAAAPVESIPATPLQPALRPLEGYIATASDKIPAMLMQLLPQSKLVVAPVATPEVEELKATWKGMGAMFGKQVASITLNADSPVYKAIGSNGRYHLSFIQKEDAINSVWMIMECTKQGETKEGNQLTILGEITNVWVK